MTDKQTENYYKAVRWFDSLTTEQHDEFTMYYLHHPSKDISNVTPTYKRMLATIKRQKKTIVKK